MAMIVVEMVLKKLGSLVSEEAELLGGVRSGVDSLRDDLESMRSFLLEAESRTEIADEGVKTWVNQVRNIAYDSQDVLEEFLLRSADDRDNGRGFFLHTIRRRIRYARGLRAKHLFAVQLRSIRKKMKALNERRDTFSFGRTNDDDVGANSSAVNQTWDDPRLASLFVDDADVVGIEHTRCLMIGWLVEGDQSLTTISVVGMGGLGKTTLVKKTYDSLQVKKHFDCRAWITVSKSFTRAKLLQDALKGLLESTKEQIPAEIDAMGDLQLVEKLRSYLQDKRYVLVFDDVWSINVWELVKFAFPDCKCGSRVMVTTRVGDVAAAVEAIGHTLHLQPLADDESWTLFSLKAFRGEDKGICPRDLEEMARIILKKCEGLPLAIVTIASLLSRKNKQALEWKKVHDSLGMQMKHNSSLESLEKILLLSYMDLPYHLKCCYLYLSIFPEDYLIKRMKIIRLWVAERFVEEKPNLTMEDVAEDYLNELVSRSLIQVVHRDYFNRVQTCRVHDLMRELISLKSREESLVMILNKGSLMPNEKVRRIALHDNCGDLPSASRFPSLRSILFFVSTGSSMSLGRKPLYGFRLLRTLELERAPLHHFPDEVSEMIHLRYLSLRRTTITELPNSIGKLDNLEVLDLKHSRISTMPKGILHLKRLCQLRNYRFGFDSSSIYPVTYGMNVPLGIGRLTSLQKLGSVEVNTNSGVVKEFSKLTQLRRLGVSKLRQEDGIELCSSLEKMKHLTSLFVLSIDADESLSLDSIASPPRLLQRLHLKCKINTLPSWIESLQFLAKLALQNSNLNEDPLKSLQGLPNLVLLDLREAYDGEELCSNSKGYPKLKKLFLYQLKHLVHIKLEKGTMPLLRELEVVACKKLDTVPLGIEHLKDLQTLTLWDMDTGFLQKIEPSQGEDFWRVKHISIFQGFLSNYMNSAKALRPNNQWWWTMAMDDDGTQKKETKPVRQVFVCFPASLPRHAYRVLMLEFHAENMRSNIAKVFFARLLDFILSNSPKEAKVLCYQENAEDIRISELGSSF